MNLSLILFLIGVLGFVLSINRIRFFLSLVNGYLVDSPQPSNLSYMWNFVFLLGFLSFLAFIIMHFPGKITYIYIIIISSSVKIALFPTLTIIWFLLVSVFSFILDKKMTSNLSIAQIFSSLALDLYIIISILEHILFSLLLGGTVSFLYNHYIFHPDSLAALGLLISVSASVYISVCICFNITSYLYPKHSIISYISYTLDEWLPYVLILGLLMPIILLIFSINCKPILLDSAPVGRTLLAYAQNYLAYQESLRSSCYIPPTSMTLSQLLELVDKSYTVEGRVLSSNPLFSSINIMGHLQRLPLTYTGNDRTVLKFCSKIVNNDAGQITIYTAGTARNSVGSKILDALIAEGI